jgi:hypothetical protein
MAGGMIGYTGGQFMPALTMVGIAGGFAATVIVFHLKNAWSARFPDIERAAPFLTHSLGREELVYGESTS